MDTEQRVQAVTDLVAALFRVTTESARAHDSTSDDWVEVIFESIAVYVGLMIGGMHPSFRETLFEAVCSRAREYFEDAEKMRQEFAEERR